MIKPFEEGDAVVLFEDITSKKLIFLQKGLKFQNKYGCFSHEQFIGVPPGSKIFSKNQKNFLILLPATPILITETLAHMTQILYEMDISMIIMKLNILPGSLVIESGTGSGSLSFSIATTIQETGHLYTFEFNKERFENARTVFKKLKKDNITVVWRDSCGKGFLPQENDEYKLPNVDSVFLDLPKPWEAVVHAAKVMKKGGRICCFSPCIEQVQKTHDALRNYGFMEMEMVESLCRNFERKERMVGGEAIQEEKEDEDMGGEEFNEKNEEFGEKNEELIEENEEKTEEKQEIIEKGGNKNKRKRKEKKKIINMTKRTFFSTGQILAKGHTGYLTFATFYQKN